MVPTAAFSAALMYLPPILYVAARAKRWNVLWLVPLVALQCSVDVAYVAPAVLVPLGAIAAWRLLHRDTRASGLRLTLALALAVLALAPLLLGYVAVRSANPSLQSQTAWATKPRIFDFLHYLFAGPAEVSSVLLWTIACAALPLVLRRRTQRDGDDSLGMWRHGLLWTIFGVALALPSTWLVNGEITSSPMGWLERLLPGRSRSRAWWELRCLRARRSRSSSGGSCGYRVLSGARVCALRHWSSRST
jgi:hypothetical protein